MPRQRDQRRAPDNLDTLNWVLAMILKKHKGARILTVLRARPWRYRADLENQRRFRLSWLFDKGLRAGRLVGGERAGIAVSEI